MEGVRGGRLVDLPAETLDKLKALRPEESAVSWAFRFLQSVPGVTVVALRHGFRGAGGG